MKSNKFLNLLVIPVFVLILSLGFFFCFGFNKDAELTGYYEIVVSNVDDYSEAVLKVKNAISEEQISIVSIEKSKDDFGTCVLLKLSTNLENTNVLKGTLSNKLFTEFGYDKDNVVEQKYISVSDFVEPLSATSMFISMGWAVLLILVGTFIYMWLRHGLASAFCSVSAIFMSVLLTLSLTLLFRFNISLQFSAAIILVAFYAAIISILYFSRLKEISQQEKYNKADNKILAFEASYGSIRNNAHLGIFLTAVLILIEILGFKFSICLSAIAGLFASIYSVHFIMPYLCMISYEKRIKKAVNKDKENAVT